ncbi:glycosyl hydrolase [Posidoniimonas polymericola]|uniref:glycosyl hydrolase n=1 Tax=Posidoniimonas polymericola TaxID=2528002 RepID=UPI0011B56B1F|nr:glycosyl hydrolase [Posidoniimonas polymericola]
MARLTKLVLLCSALAGACLTGGASELADLRSSFAEPPSEAWPRTWWHWTKGAVTEEGITKDLEWMKRAGIAGFQLADVNLGGGQSVEPAVEFGSATWLSAVRKAAREADRLGLEMAVFSSPGWSMTGGPWVKPEQAMKKLVWSEVQVTAGADRPIALPLPPTSEGEFQDLAASRPGFYRDTRVIAYPTPTADRGGPLEPARVVTSDRQQDAGLPHDASYAASLEIDAQGTAEAWVEQQFDQPVTIRAITVAGRGGIPVGRVLASDDGEHYRTLLTLPGPQLYRQCRVRTFAVPPTTARRFRLDLTGAPIRPAETMSEARPTAAERYSLCEWRLDRGARVHRWEEKAGFRHLFQYDSVATQPIGPDGAVDPAQVLDLTDRLQADGTLAWDPPQGDWTVLRLGYSLTGARNRPAAPAGRGYEVDKLSRQAVNDYYDAYSAILRQAVGDLYGTRLSHWLVDSWEAGAQNWTDRLPQEFERLRGYDPTPYLPVLVGRVVGDAETSDRFLWDFRRTLADLFAEHHYGVLQERLQADGLRLYSEASGVSLETLEDTLLNKSRVDIPMGEFWVRDLHPRLMYEQDVRGAASAAHAYGKPIIAAEAFTGGRYESPFTLKRVADYWLSLGINRLVYHTSAHQPLDTPPCNAMVGTHLHRNITWAEQARPLNAYFARICWLLQQGRAVVDLAYLLPEGAPSTPPIWGDGVSPPPPPGYQHDFINVDALLSRIDVADNGDLVLPDGMRYRVLVLPKAPRMRPEVIAKLLSLAERGATIYGPRPVGSPSLMGQPDADSRFETLAASLWGDLDGASRTIRYVGQGVVVWGRSLGKTLDRIGLREDLEWSGPLGAEIAWTHRRTDNADLYYLSNLSDTPVRLEARFRTARANAELWRPDTGAIESLPAVAADRRAQVGLELERNETLFVVFTDGETELPARRSLELQELATIDGPWEIEFAPNSGAPPTFVMDDLRSLTEVDDPGVKHFSGVATYRGRFTLPADAAALADGSVIDLGAVRDLARVWINGDRLGLQWKPPYRWDAGASLQPGENLIEIKVTNQWTNRIVGDLADPDAAPVLPGSRETLRFGPLTLEPSGLLGPVRILSPH